MDSFPKISVLMTAYNRENYIAEAIDSVLCQTFSDFELIIIDDCSIDNTFTIVENYARIDDRIRAYRNELNLGQFQNRNYAAAQAKTELLVFVDSDDTIKNDALSHIYGLFQRFQEGSYLTINRDGFYKDEMIVSSYDFVRRNFYCINNLSFGPGATAIKTKLFKEIGGFPLCYGVAGDMYYNIMAACNTPVIVCKYEFLNYRRHAGQEVNNEFSYLVNGYLYFNDIMGIINLPLTNKEREFFLKKNKRRFVTNIIKYFLKNCDLNKVITAIKSCKFTFKDFIISIFQF